MGEFSYKCSSLHILTNVELLLTLLTFITSQHLNVEYAEIITFIEYAGIITFIYINLNKIINCISISPHSIIPVSTHEFVTN